MRASLGKGNSKGVEIEVITGYEREDGWEVNYCVTETVPPPEASKAHDKEEGFLTTLLHDNRHQYLDYRQETLRLVTASVEVHQVTWIKVNTESHAVHTYRHEDHPPKY